MIGPPVSHLTQRAALAKRERTRATSHDTFSRIQPPGVRRYVSIDALRCAAILLMVQTHFVENLSSREESTGWLYDVCTWFGVLPAPLFLFASGLSFCLWARKQRTKGRLESEITRGAVRRGLFLFGAGLALNFFVWLPEDTFNWDVLTLIGTSLLILAFARKLPPVVLALICLLVLLLSPPLRLVGDYTAYWENGAYTYDFTLRDILFGFVTNGFFPVFPWIIFPLAGYLTGETLIRCQTRGLPLPRQAWTAGIALMSIASASVASGARSTSLIARHYTGRFSEYPASTAYVLAMLGLCLVGFTALHTWYDHGERSGASGPLLKVIHRFSAFSLTVYIVHHALLLWPLWCYGVWKGQADPTFYWRHAMPTPTAFGLGIVFMTLCYFGLIMLEKHQKYSFESLMRRICDRNQGQPA